MLANGAGPQTAHCFEGPVDGAGALAHPYWAMAKPIQPTPPVQGADAEALLLSLEQVAEPEEIERRRAWAERYLEQVTPKGRDDKSPKVD